MPGQITPWIADADPRVRAGAAALLGQVGDRRAAAVLLPLLADPKPEVRRAAAEALGAIGDPAALAPLLEMARAADPPLQRVALAALGKIGGDEAEKTILAALAAESHEVLLGALEGFISLESVSRPKEAAAALVRHLDRSGCPSGLHAALARLGAQAVEPLLEIFEHGSRTGRREAAHELGTFDHPLVVPALVAALSLPWGEVGPQVREALQKQGPAAEPALIQGMRHANPVVRAEAATILKDRTTDAARAALLAALDDPDGGVRKSAVYAFRGEHGTHAVPLLVRLLETDPDNSVRHAAAFALGSFDDPRARDALARLLAGDAPIVSADPGAGRGGSVHPDHLAAQAAALRMLAMESLAKFRDDRAEAMVVRTLRSTDPRPRNAAVTAAGNLGTPAAVSALAAVLPTLDSESVERAASAVASLGDRAAPALIDGLPHPDPKVRLHLLSLLERSGDTRALPSFLRALDSDDVDEAVAAIRALGASRDDRAVPPLLQALKRPELRPQAATALGSIGNRGALPALVGLLADADPAVRTVAEKAVADSTGKLSGKRPEFWVRWLEETGG